MKKILVFTCLLLNALYVNSQGFSALQSQNEYVISSSNYFPPQEGEYPISRFALSVNPLGFIEMGPIINAEVGLTKSLVLNTHVRFAPVGLLTYVVNDWPDKITGLAYGGGLIYFFGEKRNKPYLGVLSEYQKNHETWDEGESYEARELDKVFVLVVNGGYRFRFESGFFISTGAYLGFGLTNYYWEDAYNSEKGTDITPAGLVEVTLGFEF